MAYLTEHEQWLAELSPPSRSAHRSLEWRSYARALAYALPWLILVAILFGLPAIRGVMDHTAYAPSSHAVERQP